MERTLIQVARLRRARLFVVVLFAACGAPVSRPATPAPSVARRPMERRDSSPTPEPPESAHWQITGLAYGGANALALGLDARGAPTAIQVPRDTAVLRALTPDAITGAPISEVPCARLSDVTWTAPGVPMFARDSAGSPNRVLVDGQCRTTMLERTSDRGLGSAATSRDGALHMCHVTPSGELRYGALRGSSAVTFETLSSAVEGCALGAAPDGTVHLVAATRAGSLSHWSRAASGTSWAQETIGSGAQPRVVIAPDGGVHVIATATGTDGRLLHLETRDGAWRSEPVADFVLRPNDWTAPYRVALDGTGNVHVVARLELDGEVRYGRRSRAGQWRTETLGARATRGFDDAALALSMGVDQQPWVIFSSGPAGVVAVAHRTATPPVDGALPFDVAFHLRSCARHAVSTAPSPSAEGCRRLGEGGARERALPEATRLCAAGDVSMCFAQAVVTTGHVPVVYRALLAPHEGTCRPGDVCRRSISYARHQRLAQQIQSAEEAGPVFGAACERGSMQACLWQGALLGPRDAAIRPLLAACMDGQMTACVLPIDRLAPLHPDWTRAAERLRGGCERGDRLACASVAAMSAEGFGMPRDPRAAAALYARTCGALEPPDEHADPTDLPESLADDRYEIEPDDDRYFACAGLLTLASREPAARRALRGSAAVVVVAGGCTNGDGDAPSCAALARVLDRGLAGRRDRRRAQLARETACALGDRASCPPGDATE